MTAQIGTTTYSTVETLWGTCFKIEKAAVRLPRHLMNRAFLTLKSADQAISRYTTRKAPSHV